MKEDLQLAGYAEKTQQSYLDTVRGWPSTTSVLLSSKEEIRRFFLHLVNERHAARSTVTIYICGIKFLFETTLKREWTVLSREEVRTILGLVRKPIGPHRVDHHLFLWSAPV